MRVLDHADLGLAPTPAVVAGVSFGPAPHYVSLASYYRTIWAYIAVACVVLAVGVAVHGWGAVGVASLSVLTALAVQRCVNLLALPAGRTEMLHSGLIGLLVALTLPADVGWEVAVVAAGVAVGIGKAAFGGVGHYFWHPVALGRVAVELLFGLPAGENVLQALAQGRSDLAAGAEHPLMVAVRDALPAWERTLVGVGGDGIGEGCAAVLLVGAVCLIYRRSLRWQAVVGVLWGAVAAAVVFPLAVRTGDAFAWRWWAGLSCPDGLPVGLVYVLHHLTSGELMLVACLLAGETVTNPLTGRGQLAFGLAVGVLAVFLRMYGVASCAGYWALLAMNTVVPAFDRCTGVRVPRR